MKAVGDDPLWKLALNALIGVIIIAWMLATLLPFLLGREPLVPGMTVAWLLGIGWATWNGILILEGDD